MARTRLLVVDALPPASRRIFEASSLPPLAEGDVALLRAIDPAIECEVTRIADETQPVPDLQDLRRFAGVLWTGTPLSVMDDVPGISRQLDFMRLVFDAGLPVFGICGGLQIGVVSAGGTVVRNPLGLESGVARRIRLTSSGRKHPLFQFRDGHFDAFCDHFDSVESLPPGAEVLAFNESCPVQAAAFRAGECEFWGVQYHPDFTPAHLRLLAGIRGADWLRAGLIIDEDDLELIRRAANRLEVDPSDRSAAWLLGLDSTVLDPRSRSAEVRAWLKTAVQD